MIYRTFVDLINNELFQNPGSMIYRMFVHTCIRSIMSID
jgi:hypothetical protein